MTIKIKYCYLKDQTWMFRRNYPADVRFVLGTQALKQSLRTSDPRVARTRASEVNARYDQIVATTRTNGKASLELLAEETAPSDPDQVWPQAVETLRSAMNGERTTLPAIAFHANPGRNVSRRKVDDLAAEYLRKRAKELRPGGLQECAVFGRVVFLGLWKQGCVSAVAGRRQALRRTGRTTGSDDRQVASHPKA